MVGKRGSRIEQGGGREVWRDREGLVIGPAGVDEAY